MEVRSIMMLSERTGLKMAEWSYRKEDNIITFRCKKFPLCHSRINFEINHGGTRRPKLANTYLKHNHPPDWVEGCQIDKKAWSVLTHP